MGKCCTTNPVRYIYTRAYFFCENCVNFDIVYLYTRACSRTVYVFACLRVCVCACTNAINIRKRVSLVDHIAVVFYVQCAFLAVIAGASQFRFIYNIFVLFPETSLFVLLCVFFGLSFDRSFIHSFIRSTRFTRSCSFYFFSITFQSVFR